MQSIRGLNVAALVGSGFEQAELIEPRRALESAGARVEVVSPKKDSVRAWKRTDWGDDFAVDRHVSDLDADSHSALLIPGGLLSADYLRMDQRAVDLVQQFMRANKPVAALCHGVWLLVEANVVAGRSLTSYPSLRVDVENAGGRWRDEPVVLDGSLITLRRQDDIDELCRKLIELLSAAPRRAQRPFGPPDQRLQR